MILVNMLIFNNLFVFWLGSECVKLIKQSSVGLDRCSKSSIFHSWARMGWNHKHGQLQSISQQQSSVNIFILNCLSKIQELLFQGFRRCANFIRWNEHICRFCGVFGARFHVSSDWITGFFGCSWRLIWK